MKLTHEATQELVSVLRPNVHQRDLRHRDDEAIMRYDIDQELVREGLNNSQGATLTERIGVLHLVHCWHQQGHPVSCFFL